MKRLSPLARYSIAVAAAALATLLRLGLDPLFGLQLPFITFFPAIALSAWLGGLGPGIVTTLLCAAAGDFIWVHSFALGDAGELAGLLLFVAVGGFISGLNEAWRRAVAASAASEERLRVTLGSIADGVITTDGQGRVSRMNAVARSLTGWSEADAAGRPLGEVFAIVDEETRQPAENPVPRVLRDGVVSGLANHTLLLSKDGREIPVDDSAAPIFDAAGGVAGVVMVFRDVTARRRAEHERAALLENERTARKQAETAEQQLRLALEAGRLGTWQWTMETGEVKWSPGLERIHGLEEGSFRGTFDAVQQEIHPEDRGRVQKAVAAAVERAGAPYQVEYRIVRPDGAERWVEGRGGVVRDAEGRPVRMVGVCSDVTERKQADQERAALLERERAARAELERASQLKEDFLAVLSHELRTPLSAVLTWAELLRSGRLPPERASHALQAIERNARAEARLVESLLDVSRVIAGKLELKSEPVDLGSAVSAAVDAVRPAAEASGLGLEVVIPPAPIVTAADASRLEQVVWNLLANAVKFTPRGGHVRVQLESDGSRGRILVSDDGQGIPAGFLPFVFDRFTQADTAKDRAQRGLGLGLAIARELVQGQGGAIEAHSPGEGRGSTFVVTLPIREAAAVREAESGSRAGETTAGRAPASLFQLRVLLVEDHADAREALCLALEAKGAIVRTAASADEALVAIRRSRPDVLVADIGMPRQDGYALMRRLRAMERERQLARLPAVALTAYASASDREQALAAGYDGHLSKPVAPDDLSQALLSASQQPLDGA